MQKKMQRTVTVLGSTGSVGRQTMQVIRELGVPVYGISGGKNSRLLEEQIRLFHPAVCAVADERAARDLCVRTADLSVQITAGTQAIEELAAQKHAQLVYNSILGTAGLSPTLAAIESGHDIALSNKETLVAAGAYVMQRAREKHVRIIPVDSEHCAIAQCLCGKTRRQVKRLILTCSGGPYFGYTTEQLQGVTKEHTLAHPTWHMGAKITVDCATLMNKGLEFIEAKWLFDMPNDDIEIVVHRESVVHSAIVYQDNSMIAQLGVPDMRIPIQYALTYPERLESPVKYLSLADYGKLTFFEPDYETFKCIDVCRNAIELGGLHPAAANGANEESVRLFLNGKIKFTDIAYLNNEAMKRADDIENFTLADVLEADRRAREFVLESVN